MKEADSVGVEYYTSLLCGSPDETLEYLGGFTSQPPRLLEREDIEGEGANAWLEKSDETNNPQVGQPGISSAKKMCSKWRGNRLIRRLLTLTLPRKS